MVVKVVERVAVPELSVPVPSVVVPLLNVTVPVAADGETVAVNVTGEPTVGVVVDGVSVVVVAVVPVPVDPGACQKFPQPVSSNAPVKPANMSTALEEKNFTLIKISILRLDTACQDDLHEEEAD